MLLLGELVEDDEEVAVAVAAYDVAAPSAVCSPTPVTSREVLSFGCVASSKDCDVILAFGVLRLPFACVVVAGFGGLVVVEAC